MSIGYSVTQHPDLEEIVEFFNRGGSVRELERMLENRYGSGHKYSLNQVTLNGFRKNYMGLDKAQVAEIRNLRKLNEFNSSREEKDITAMAKVGTCLSILEKKEEFLQNDIDVIDEQVKLLAKIDNQISQLSELENSLTDPNKKLRAKEILSKYIGEWRQFLEGVHKRQAELVAKPGNNFSANNMQINITQVNAYVDDIKQAVMETFREECPQLLPLFLTKLSTKVNSINKQQFKRNDADIIDIEVR